METVLLAAFVPLLLAAAAPADIVTEADLRRHIAVLASDAFEGRAPGTEGQTKTIAYIAEAFSKAGLISGTTGNPWYQPVPLVERAVSTASARFSRRDMPIAIEPDEIALRSWQARADMRADDMLFLGYATDARSADVRGRVILLLRDEPANMEGIPDYADRRDTLLKRGAAAVIGIAGADTPFEALRRGYRRRGTQLASAAAPGIDGLISLEAAAAILHASRLEVAALVEEAADPGYAGRTIDVAVDLSVSMDLRPYDSFNVIGKIAGSDPAAGAILITGHWDHLGLCRPEGEPDRICNGAVDNASGIALMIETARRLRQGARPVRDIYFIATTAEEKGLLGAHGFVENPVVPLDRVQAVLNVDTVALAPRGTPIAVIGRGGVLDAPIATAARIAGRTIDPDGDADAYLRRQDGWAFAERGIPAAMLVSAFSDKARLDAYLSSRYHRPDDALTDATELGGAAEDATFHVILARLLADPLEYRR